ncbi:MAG: acetolactate synthase small subunit [Clostridiales bacterium]|nr:acetolactate synthase small subunit [Clostridiales bacterium]
MEELKTAVISALVSNKPGVLNRVAGLFSKRSYNIESLSVCTTEDERLSRMTIVAKGDEAILEQIVKQLAKLIDVKKALELDTDASLMRELILIKIKVLPHQRPEVESTANIYKAKTVDLSPDSMVLELTGDEGKIDAFINILKHYGIIELARTGVMVLQRGDASIKANDENE